MCRQSIRKLLNMAANYDDVVAQLTSAGLIVESLQTGRLTRCKVEGDRERRGWYMLHELALSSGDVVLVGSYGVWRGNENNTQRIDLQKRELSKEQRESLRKRLAEDRRRAERERKAAGARAAARAAKVWSKCLPTGDSEYLGRKGVGGHGVRYSPSGAMVIPMLDLAGTIHGLQIIRGKSLAQSARRPEKEFWPAGLVKKGHFHLIGTPTNIVLVGEGYATCATLHEATGFPVAVAYDAGNLAPVASALHKRYPLARILVCADDDAFTPGNPGVTAASAAALESAGAMIVPRFADEDARAAAFEQKSQKLSDFNDLHQLEGLHVVRTQVEARLSELGWRAGGTRVAGVSTTGGEGKGVLRPIETLDELLERYALVYGQGGTVFDSQEHCLLSLSDMRDACLRRELHRAWAEHPEREIVRVREVGFDPAGEDPEVRCNLWGGWPTTPKAGRCETLLELLQYMCAEDDKPDDLYNWVLRWLAYPIQHPGAKMKTTLVIHGPQGTGKNMFFECIMGIYGQYGRVIDQAAIEDKFNDWASRKLFLIADEVVARSDLYHVKNKLKAFITGDWIRINPKNLAAYEERNHVNMVFLSNERMPVVLEEDDRRHAVIWTPAKLSPMFYRDVQAEISAGGIAALHDYLLNLDLGDFRPSTLPPMTRAKSELINLSLDSTSRFYQSLLSGDIDGVNARPALSQDVYDLYRAWCSKMGIAKPAPLPRLIDALQRKHGVPSSRKRYLMGQSLKGPHGVVILGDEKEPPVGTSETSWLGAHIESFRVAVKDYKGGAGAYAD